MCRPNNQPAHPREDCTSTLSTDTAFTTATVFEKPTTKLDVKDITSFAELAALKTSDPFMYFSIPSVRDAVLDGRQAELSMLGGSQKTGSDGSREGQVVTRETRIAFERHPDEMLAGLIAEYDFGGDESEMMTDDHDDLVEEYFSYVFQAQ